MKRLLAILLLFSLLCGCRAEETNSSAFSFTAVNTRGNTNGNIANLGLAAAQDEWIFFCDLSDEGRLKATKDGGRTSIELMADLDDTYACLNLVGQTLNYISSSYSDLNAVLLDEETAVSVWTGHSYCMQVYDGDVWFIDESGTGLVTRLDAETGETVTYGSHPAYLESVTNESVHTSFSLDNGYLYYAAADDNNRIYRVNLSSNEEACLADASATVLAVQDGAVYFTDANEGNRLFRLKNGKTVLLTETGVGTFNVEGSTVWYTDTSASGSPLMKLENGIAARVCDVPNTMYVSRVNHLLVLYTSDGEIYFVSDDGVAIKP